MSAASRVCALGFIAALAMTGCTTTPDYPQPAADKAQIVVKVTATPKTGAGGPHTEGQYDKESVEKGRRFTRVNYSKMDCIAVVVNGGSPTSLLSGDSGTIEITREGFSKDLSIAYSMGGDANRNAVISIVNRRDAALTLFGSLQSGGDEGLFELHIPAQSNGTCTLPVMGLYDVYCDEDETLFCQIIATNSPYATICESGGEAFFDDLQTGTYEVEVYAPRLPVWRAKITTTAGKRETLYAEVTVNSLPKAK